jgi:hypothetical protein
MKQPTFSWVMEDVGVFTEPAAQFFQTRVNNGVFYFDRQFWCFEK